MPHPSRRTASGAATMFPFAGAALPKDPHWVRFLFCGYLIIVGFRLFVIERFGVSVPFMDEWVATGPHVLVSWVNGTFSPSILFDAHLGDHRIVATRLWEILWFEINGGWDPKLVMLTKAFVFAAAGIIFVHLLSRGLDRGRYVAGALFIVMFALPFGYQNLLWAFQSQFDFFLLATALGWFALLSGRPKTALVIAAVAPFTLAAGPLIAAGFVPFAIAALLRKTWPLRHCVWFGAVALAITIGGSLLRVAEGAPPHTVGEKTFTLLTLLGWPSSNLVLLVYRIPETTRLFPGVVLNFPSTDVSAIKIAAAAMQDHRIILVTIQALWSAVMLMPLVMLALRVWRERRVPANAWGPLALGTFALLLQGTTALVRAGEMTVPARFLDVVALTGIASIAASISLMSDVPRLRRLLALWLVIIAPGYLITAAASFKQMKNARWPELLASVQVYFPNHDRSVLPPDNENWQIPWFSGADPQEFGNVLDNRELEAILPLSVTQPSAPPLPVSRTAQAIAKRGWLIAAIAALAACWVALAGRREAKAPTPSLVRATAVGPS